jgi:hypothetical protein
MTGCRVSPISERRSRRGDHSSIAPATRHDIAPGDLGAGLDVTPDPGRHGLNLMAGWAPRLDHARHDRLGENGLDQ